LDRDTTRALILAAVRGDMDAFSALVSEHQTMVYHLALSMVHHREDALDVSQEVFLKLYRFLPSFQFESAFTTWLYRLTKNTALDFLRSAKRRSKASLDHLTEQGMTLPDPEEQHDPYTETVASERRMLLYRAIARLSDSHREILVLHAFCGLSYEEIAETLNIELGTVKSRLNRAKQQLRKLLEMGNFF